MPDESETETSPGTGIPAGVIAAAEAPLAPYLRPLTTDSRRRMAKMGSREPRQRRRFGEGKRPRHAPGEKPPPELPQRREAVPVRHKKKQPLPARTSLSFPAAKTMIL
jgi:hypothetical protein